jgi:aspartate/methionine/tyrosine aminotransferase
VYCILGNPIGNFSSKQKLLELLNFAKQRELHVVIDEIYGNCIYDKKFEFQSVLSFFDEIPDPLRTHFMWSFSKDLCCAGLRCGVIYSQNELLVQAISKLGLVFSTPYATQHKLSLLLKDKNWLDNFFEINHERMLKSKELMTMELLKLDLKILQSCSGFFLWVDFRLVFSPTLSSHEITFEKEMVLFDIFFKNGVYVVPGINIIFNCIYIYIVFKFYQDKL